MNAQIVPTIIRSLIVAGGLALGFTVSACAEDESFDNVTGCEIYVEEVSAAFTDCGMDPSGFADGVACSLYADITACDIGDYWACLGGGYSCDTDTMTLEIDPGILAECASLAMCD